ncbi:unnamed protein product [Strongylus vulgaris]|uniref:Fibronectin type-III domain-containing protein n=1 Tax=Strongylus vulgaris TaxID=40348 RepID=A0A3P7L5Y2_STRVU|nr:unnamed protein product [Strongylus vulgaris]
MKMGVIIKWNYRNIIGITKPINVVMCLSHNYDIRPATLYRLRATVLINQAESSPSKLVLVNTREAAAKSPVIQSVKVLANGSAIVQFIPADDVDVKTNYTVEYRDVSSFDPSWTSLEFESDSSSEVLLSGLLPNRTYETRLFVNGNIVHGICSRTVLFSTNQTAQLPEVSLIPQEEIVLDPDVSQPLEVKCSVISSPPSNIRWLVDGNPLPVDHSFYTVTNTAEDDNKITSTIHIKSRTRNDDLTCIAANPAGQVSKTIAVRIRGPGSPPSAVALQSERGGYTVTWQPPSHPNGNITKYVVYHSFNKEYPLADWQKLVLDGTENSVRTRNDDLTCIAANPAGQVSKTIAVRIRGPGSPPSAVALQSERGGYTVTWQPPSHPNGNITKYVVYHSFNKEYPLADWQKLVLDGTENSVRVLSEAEDAFYVRVQAAADSGPGVISDIVAVEKDSKLRALLHFAVDNLIRLKHFWGKV